MLSPVRPVGLVRVGAVLAGDFLDREAERRDRVGHRQRVGVLELDLVLGGRDLVMRGLDRDPHLLEVLDRATAEIRRGVERCEVEVGESRPPP